MLMSRNKKAEVRRSSYWAEFPAEERNKRRNSTFAKAERKVASERRSSKWKSRFHTILGRSRPSSSVSLTSLHIETMIKTGWELRHTLDGSAYYYELDTGRVSWDKPESLKTAKEKEEDKAEWVWVPHPTNVWQPGRLIQREKSGAATVRTMTNETVKVSHIGIMKGKITGGVSQKVPLWPLKRAALDREEDDLVALPALDEGMIMHNLRVRYEKNEIYTWVGSSRSVLISINPFQSLPLYGKEQIDLQRKGAAAASLGVTLPPHVFAIANDSLDALLFENKSQSILVSGESGAGKTHATKQCLDFLASVAASKKAGGRDSRRFEMTMSASADPDQKVEQKVLVANPVLEAFGNAKTVRNNNSSRFGKWISVHVDRRSKQINGAQITSFLLESSRVTMQAKNERNYHVFYQLMHDEGIRERYMLTSGAESFHYLNQSGCISVDGIDDAKEFEDVISALEQLGFEDEEQEWLMRTTAAVLHLGNITFEEIKLANGQKGCKLEGSDGPPAPSKAPPAEDKEQGEGEGEGEGEAVAEEAAEEEEEEEDDSQRSPAQRALARAAELLEIEGRALERVLSQRSITVRGEHSLIPLKVKQAVQARDSLAKAIYSRMFDWLVRRVNEAFGDATGKFIGILDIFGFEIFEHNTFEQLCINYCNERLQQLFNQHTFGDEEELYEIEKVQFRHIKFQDNQPVLDLIDKRPDGILNLLDDECVVPGGTDARLMGRIEAVHKDHKFFQALGSSSSRNKAVARGAEDALTFSVKHFAGTVTYDAQGFLTKNSDTLFQDLYDICSQSEDSTTQDLFPVLEENDRVKVVSQSGKFRAQLNELMALLHKTQSRYIRCIKPNGALAPNLFEGRKCLEQLRSSGVFEAVEIRKTGYPFRLLHDEFVRRYRCINLNYKYKSNLDSDHGARAFCNEILEASPQKLAGVQLGEMRVLYRVEDHKMLELLRDLALATEVPKIQAAWRRGLARKLRRQLAKAEQALRDAMSGEPDLVAVETAIEEAPDTMGSIGNLYRINPPSLAKAKAMHAGLEQWEDVEEELEEFESAGKGFDRAKAEETMANADRLRGEGVPMTERQKELYDHVKQLMVGGGSVEDLEEQVEEALESLERDKVEEVSEAASEWARSSEALDRVKETAGRFKRLDEDGKRAIEMVDRALLSKVSKEAAELGYTDGSIQQVNELLELDELTFVKKELASAQHWGDRRRRKQRALRVREIELAQSFTNHYPFFSMERVRGHTAHNNSCVNSLMRKPRSAAAAKPSAPRPAYADADAGKQELDDEGAAPADDKGKLSSTLTSRTGPGASVQFANRIDKSVLLQRSKNDSRLAVRNFEDVRTYMGDSKRATSNAARNVAGLQILKLGLENEYLRDEIYAQVIMQLTNNPSEESVMAGVDLLCLVVRAFPPSDEHIENYFTVWAKLHMPNDFYTTMMSVLHDHRFAKDPEQFHLRLLALLYRRDEEGDAPIRNSEAIEIMKAEHFLDSVRTKFKNFENGSRYSLKQAWESDPWEKNPAFRRLRRCVVPSGLRVSQLKGFSSGDDSEMDTPTRAIATRFKMRLGQLQNTVNSSLRNFIDGATAQPQPRTNRSGSVVEVLPSRKERAQEAVKRLLKKP